MRLVQGEEVTWLAMLSLPMLTAWIVDYDDILRWGEKRAGVRLSHEESSLKMYEEWFIQMQWNLGKLVVGDAGGAMPIQPNLF